MTPKTAAPSIGDLEQELYSVQVKLFPLYAAQEAANVDATNAVAAQASASGSALTDAVLAARKYRAEVEKFTDEIRPLKEQADALRRKIEAAKHAAHVAKVVQHARAAADLAPKVSDSLTAFLAELSAFITQLNAMGSKDVRSEIRALARHIEVRLWDAGLPNYKSEGVQFHGTGTPPAEVAATAVALAETL